MKIRLLLGLMVAGAYLATPALAQQQLKERLWPNADNISHAEETISMAMTYPIPIKGGPPNCAVSHTDRYCRADKKPIRSFNVLEQRLSGTSKIESTKIVDGCFVAKVTLSVAVSTDPKFSCEGGEAKFALKVQVLSTASKP